MPVPVQMVAGEQEPLAKEQHAMPARMARRGNRQEVDPERGRLVAIEDDLRARLGRKLLAMDDPLAAKRSA